MSHINLGLLVSVVDLLLDGYNDIIGQSLVLEHYGCITVSRSPTIPPRLEDKIRTVFGEKDLQNANSSSVRPYVSG